MIVDDKIWTVPVIRSLFIMLVPTVAFQLISNHEHICLMGGSQISQNRTRINLQYCSMNRCSLVALIDLIWLVFHYCVDLTMNESIYYILTMNAVWFYISLSFVWKKKDKKTSGKWKCCQYSEIFYKFTLQNQNLLIQIKVLYLNFGWQTKLCSWSLLYLKNLHLNSLLVYIRWQNPFSDWSTVLDCIQ